MIKKMLGVFTSIVAALVVVGVAWAGGDDSTSTSITAASDTSATVASGVSTPSTAVTIPDSSTSTSVKASTSTSTNASTSTSIAETTSTSAAGNSTTSTSIGSSTSTSVDDSDARQVPDGVSTHLIPGVGTVTLEVNSGQLVLVSVSAPGWKVERNKIEPDRIELEFTSGLKAEAEFDARLKNGRVEVEIEVELG